MTDDELAEIEEWLHSHLLAEPLLRVSRLIAEVRRLKAENERLNRVLKEYDIRPDC